MCFLDERLENDMVKLKLYQDEEIKSIIMRKKHYYEGSLILQMVFCDMFGIDRVCDFTSVGN